MESGSVSSLLEKKTSRLTRHLRSLESCLIGFSGGIDSALLAAMAVDVLQERAVAVTCVSESMPGGESDEARRVAREIGIRHEVLPTNEVGYPAYRLNDAERCYHCRSVMLAAMHQLRRDLNLAYLVDGANADDVDDYRPGLRAAREHGVVSPLAEAQLTKAELRALARERGLSVADKPSSPCLSSRIAYNVEITPERLRMVDRGEAFLRENGFSPLRVRYHAGDVARIEVSQDAMHQLLEPALRRRLIASLRAAGFRFIALDLEGFRSGSLNALLGHEDVAPDL